MGFGHFVVISLRTQQIRIARCSIHNFDSWHWIKNGLEQLYRRIFQTRKNTSVDMTIGWEYIYLTLILLGMQLKGRTKKMADRGLHLIQSFLFKIQDYFIISFQKLKRGWTLTTSQYTITHTVYFRTKKTVIKNTKVTSWTN